MDLPIRLLTKEERFAALVEESVKQRRAFKASLVKSSKMDEHIKNLQLDPMKGYRDASYYVGQQSDMK